MSNIFDFSFSRPSIDDLKAAGAVGVARYLSSYPGPKNADKAEVEGYWAAGLKVLLVWENDTHDTDGGYNTGAHAGTSARAQATALGFPVDHVLYWAVDRRLTDSMRVVALDYGKGFRDAAGLSRPYGEGRLIDAAVDAGLCDYGWMPETWGPCSHLALVQKVSASPIPSTDLNIPQIDDWGGYSPGGDDMALSDDDKKWILDNVLNIVRSEAASGGGDPNRNGNAEVLAAVKALPGSGNASTGKRSGTWTES